jgi:AraC-like DNA-binding protein
MKYHYEEVLRPGGECIQTDDVIGPVSACVFHVHPEPELTWVESSFGVRFVGDNISEFRENDLVLVGSMVPHHYTNSAKDSTGPTWSRFRVIKFGEEFMDLLGLSELEPIASMFEKSSEGLVFPGQASSVAGSLMKEIFAAKGPRRIVLLLELLSGLSASSYVTLSTVGATDSVSSERMDRVIDYVHGRLHKGAAISLAEAAKVACMRPQAFSRYFHKSARKRFIDYITELKVGRASGLLANGDRSVLDVALESGFRNLSNFNRHFRRLKKLSPREYREAFRASGNRG